MYRIFGTEEDKVNCSFYFKIGACRHGERCSRLHMKPNFSQTLLLAHFYMPPAPDANGTVIESIEHYDDFYDDVLTEMIKYGDVEEFVVCENLGDHMFGNTYVKFATEEQAHKALMNLRGRYFCGRIVQAEYSPVTDFREGRCRQFDERNCLRGGYCNFLHLKSIPRFARRYLRRTRLRNRYRHPYGLHYQTKRRDDNWPRFPIRGTSEERRRCIKKWNAVLDEERKNGKHQKRKEKENAGGNKNVSGMNVGGNTDPMINSFMNGISGNNGNGNAFGGNNAMMSIANVLAMNMGQSNTGLDFMFGGNKGRLGVNVGSNLGMMGMGMGMGPPVSATAGVQSMKNEMDMDGSGAYAVNGSGSGSGSNSANVKSNFDGAFINPERLRMINNT